MMIIINGPELRRKNETPIMNTIISFLNTDHSEWVHKKNPTDQNQSLLFAYTRE